MSSELLLGLGSTVDYEIEWDAAVLEQLAEEHAITAAELDPARPIVDERGLVVSILSFLQAGRGAERFVADAGVLEQFSLRFRYAATLGGTGLRAALSLAKLGIPGTVHLVSVNDTIRELLPAEVSWVSGEASDSTDPHVILQYPAGAAVRLPDATLVAPHANRLIYVNDPPNRELLLSDRLEELVARSRVFLASGFNSIQDATILEDRLDRVGRAMAGRPRGAVAIFEDAGSHDPRHGLRVRDVMARTVDVYGLNEDELFGYLGVPFDLLDAGAVEHALHAAAAVIPAPTLVVHSKYWAIALGRDAHRWRAALDAGVTMAATRFVAGDAVDPAAYAAMERMPRRAAAIELAAELGRRLGGDVVCVPAYELLPERPTTIGLGDSFVGGFIAAIARQPLPSPLPARGASA